MILKGNPVSPGMALGKVFLYKPFLYTVQERYFKQGEETKYLKVLDDAIHSAKDELDSLMDSFGENGSDRLKILEAHKEILMDEEILEMTHEAVATERKMPDFAVSEVFSEFIGILGKAKDPLIAGRVADLKDVRNRVLRNLLGEPEQDLSNLPGNVIFVTRDLLPSVTANLNCKNVLAIVTEVGGTTSHSAIIARSAGIPAVLGVENATEFLHDGEEAAVNALNGTVQTALTQEQKERFYQEKAGYTEKNKQAAEFLTKASVMADGTRIETGINIGSDKFDEGFYYGDFVGLFRTEFLYMENNHLPDEEEQFEAYKKVVEYAGGKPVTFRTLDIGGDKTLSYLQLPKEQNPFLGERALRFCLNHPGLFKAQLRAILRASAFGKVWIMFPMVASMDDVDNAKRFLSEAKNELDTKKLDYDKSIKVGVMIETPSAALIADKIAREVDFASVGTNDLCQYLTAVDRMNSAISSYYQSLSPAMLRVLKLIADEFIAAGKSLSVCGELAGDPKAAVVLAGLGIKKLSMNSSNLACVKSALAKFTAEESARLVEKLLSMRTMTDVVYCLNETILLHQII